MQGQAYPVKYWKLLDSDESRQFYITGFIVKVGEPYCKSWQIEARLIVEQTDIVNVLEIEIIYISVKSIFLEVNCIVFYVIVHIYILVNLFWIT